MSLVSDALRRARAEAAERDRAPTPLPTSLRPSAPPRRGRGGAALAILAAAAATLVIAAVLAWPRWAPPAAVAPARVASLERAPQETPPELPVVAVPLPPPDALAGGAPAAAEAVTSPVAVAPPAAPAPGAGAVEPASATVAPDRAGAEARDVFARAELGYATLELDYIVFRADAPFAQINGHDVVVGSVVLGFVVEQITPEAVHLRDDRGPLVLRARR